MEIRLAVKEDGPELFSCSVEAFKDYILLIDGTPAPLLKDYCAAISKDHVFVAEEEGRVVGFVSVQDRPEEYMWLDVLAVRPQCKGKGIGRKLIEQAHDFMRSSGKPESRLCTHVKYERTQSLYLYIGYEIYDRAVENGLDRFYFKKSLVEG